MMKNEVLLLKFNRQLLDDNERLRSENSMLIRKVDNLHDTIIMLRNEIQILKFHAYNDERNVAKEALDSEN